MTLEERVNRIERILNLGQKSEPMDAEAVIRDILLDLGAPDSLNGHAYTVESILMCLLEPKLVHCTIKGLYPMVADKFGTTVSRVERSIRHMIEVMWERADYEVLVRYFGNTISADRGRPTNSEFIGRITNVVRQRMKANT